MKSADKGSMDPNDALEGYQEELRAWHLQHASAEQGRVEEQTIKRRHWDHDFPVWPLGAQSHTAALLFVNVVKVILKVKKTTQFLPNFVICYHQT